MRFIAEINCDNAAFEEYPGTEVAKQLREIADKVEDRDPGDTEKDNPVTSRDGSNGPPTGRAYYEEVW